MKKYEIDMVHGPLFKKIILFSIPVILSGVLQLLFNAADIVVVGRYAGSKALAAVGSTTALINLLVNLFIGLSIGANVLVGQFIGANQEQDASQTVHTAMATSITGGILLGILGICVASPILHLMGTPEDVVSLSVLYMRIFFIGMPFNMIYNFGAALLRAIGDTRRPLYYLSFAGVINVLLNLLFVIVFHLSVAGVALATISAQAISSILVVRCLMKEKGLLHLDLKCIRFHKNKFIRMIKIGVPAGFQGCLFSISNVLIQSSINSFGSIAMAGNTAAGNIEGFVYIAMNGIHQTALSFTSQNRGANEFNRIDRILFLCLSIVLTIGLIMGSGAYIFGRQLLGIYTSQEEVIQYGLLRLSYVGKLYFFCGLMDVIVGVLRGMGYSLMPMFVTLIGVCAVRVLWLVTIFQWVQTLDSIYISYPVTWSLTVFVLLIGYGILRKKMREQK